MWKPADKIRGSGQQLDQQLTQLNHLSGHLPGMLVRKINVFLVMKYMAQAHVVFCASKDARFYFHGLHKNFLLLFIYVPEPALYGVI